ncbi:hypothetical protein RvY_18015 [Ramazzottius varieornatus]|uniref:hAT-like transposase RNase-H fold domain-containing protein n=1 Tax=Ramazzottius varieornatus TaxID=947166 RepID=A0A1D1W478_RAMVA|nr:hypothetical protein RvY_18015 [Ramazzottius varieornatus]
MAEHALQLDWDKVGLDKKYRLSPDHEVVLKQFVKITKPFQDAFMKLQRHHIPAICNVLPILFGLRIQLTNMIASGECMLLEKYSLELLALLEERFDKFEDDDLYLAAAFLDPTIKLRFSRGSKKPKETESRTRALILRMMRDVRLEEGRDDTALPDTRKSRFVRK